MTKAIAKEVYGKAVSVVCMKDHLKTDDLLWEYQRLSLDDLDQYDDDEEQKIGVISMRAMTVDSSLVNRFGHWDIETDEWLEEGTEKDNFHLIRLNDFDSERLQKECMKMIKTFKPNVIFVLGMPDHPIVDKDHSELPSDYHWGKLMQGLTGSMNILTRFVVVLPDNVENDGVAPRWVSNYVDGYYNDFKKAKGNKAIKPTKRKTLTDELKAFVTKPIHLDDVIKHVVSMGFRETEKDAKTSIISIANKKTAVLYKKEGEGRFLTPLV
ncbi:hypothetical protein ACFL53_00180 [Pseudomonadota bacterium]